MSPARSAQTYRNVMEPLVVEEVERHIASLPPKVAQYINKAEAIAYALNRLPPLYATSERGWEQQQAKASREMRSQITAAARQAIAAIQRDPIRSTSPLRIDADRDANEALQGLKELLRSDDLSWHNLVDTVERMLIQTARGEITWRKRGSSVTESQGWQDNRYTL
ncbi:MAG: late competence development ComFB family protein [Oscillatoriales cyanobacterium C42_A2020_001]|nr:late competence development ComFB family protein [Leptolyngbyaceae cyanobacterium C42_A2020_001]